MNKKTKIVVCSIGGVLLAIVLVILGIVIGQYQVINNIDPKKPVVVIQKDNFPVVLPPNEGVGVEQDYTFKYQITCEGCTRGEYTVKFRGPTGLTSEAIPFVKGSVVIGGLKIIGNSDYQLSISTWMEMFAGKFDKSRMSLIGNNLNYGDIYGILDQTGQKMGYVSNPTLTGVCEMQGDQLAAPCGIQGIKLEQTDWLAVSCTSQNVFDTCNNIMKTIKINYAEL